MYQALSINNMIFLKSVASSFLGKFPRPRIAVSAPSSIRKMDVHQATPDFYNPRPQPFYEFKDGVWAPSHGVPSLSFNIGSPIKLLSWNIDFQTPLSSDRMTAALAHLYHLIVQCSSSIPALILLQEMTATDLVIIQSTPWIRASFYITECARTNWLAHYGTLTLVDRRLPLASIFRVRYASDMGRDALFVDIEDQKTSAILRVCNTHLESLRAIPPLRPAQVKLVSRYLKDPTVKGRVIAGDFNAIEDFDLTLHVVNGLQDAYLEEGKEEAAEEGWTWGMQSLYGQGAYFGSKRMDKILFCGRTKVKGIERFGMGIKTLENNEVPALFVTDHLGLMAEIYLMDEEG